MAVEKEKAMPLVFEEVKLGLLINFNVTLLKNGIKRIANNLFSLKKMISLCSLCVILSEL